MLENHEPPQWCVVFNTEGDTFWGRLIPGRFKHVRAFTFLPKTKIWIFYDVSFTGTTLSAMPDGPDARAAMWQFIGPIGKSYIVSVKRLPQRSRIFPWSNWCTTALRHLLNLPGSALRPDAFFRECLENGGTPFEQSHESTDIHPAAARSNSDGLESASGS